MEKKIFNTEKEADNLEKTPIKTKEITTSYFRYSLMNMIKYLFKGKINTKEILDYKAGCEAKKIAKELNADYIVKHTSETNYSVMYNPFFIADLSTSKFSFYKI